MGIAYAINGSGQAVGQLDFSPTSGDHDAFHWEQGVLTPLPGLGGVEENSSAHGINDAGQVVGSDLSAESEHGSLLHAFVWQEGVIADLGQGTAQAINRGGQIVGSTGQLPGADGHAFLWVNGVFRDLGTLDGHQNSVAYGINAAGQIVGTSNTTDPSFERGPERAFLWKNGRMTDLGTLGGDYSAAYGINAAGQVVGTSNTSSGGPEHAFLWEQGVMTDLGTLGGARSTARAIND
jgi:probable HAF family extracellular repeat protein